MNCKHCGSPRLKSIDWAFECGSQDSGRYPYQSNKCQLRSSILKLESERDALQARVQMLEDALGLVLKMHNDWLEMQEDGYAGAYYAFVKGNDHEWDSIIKAKESKL